MIAATKSISKGDYSIRVVEEGEGEILELLHSFNQVTAELEGTELMRNDFINNFSHEFKTPIVSGICQTAASKRFERSTAPGLFGLHYQ
nr:HAMP domain-containing protein [uncultured Dysosmobacter sp.]